MKFNVSKPKKNFAKREENHSSKCVDSNTHENITENILFSIKTKTKMKRSHAKLNGKILNPMLNLAQNDQELNNQEFVNLNFKGDKNFQKVSLKKIGNSFANLFKSSKRNCIRMNNNIQIDNDRIFFPVPIKFNEANRKNEPSKLIVKEIPSSNVINFENKINSKSTFSLNQNNDEKLNHQRIIQPSMGLKAYNIKSNNNKIKFEQQTSNIEKKLTIENKMLRNSFIKAKNKEQQEFFSTKSDSNLLKDLKPSEDLYDCLINYESNKLYNDLARDIKRTTDHVKLNYEQDNEIEFDNTLIPFLDQTKETYIQPILSSTAADFENDIEFFDNGGERPKLHITPLRFMSNNSKMKKLRSFSRMFEKNE